MIEPSSSPLQPPILVLDTNTVLALWMFHDPALEVLRQWIHAGSCRLVSRADALEELRRVLAYAQFGLDADRQDALRARYIARLAVLPDDARAGDLPGCRDPDDQKFLEIAGAAGAATLITRDKALLRLARHRLVRARFAILTPERMQQALSPPTDAPN